MEDFRTEHDSMGEVKVPADKYWAAQTQRSLEHFKIGNEKMPRELIKALAMVKKSAATVNHKLGLLDERLCKAISGAADEIIEDKLWEHFPLSVWQTGSGTQTNMNVNEVIANRGNELLQARLLHPNDHCNMSQSSNDVFPTAMHIAAVSSISKKLLPEIEILSNTLRQLIDKNEGIIKIGRTHLQDATPISFSQEISGWLSMLEHSRDFLISSLEPLHELAIGGTAVGTGLNAPSGFDVMMSKELSRITGFDFKPAANKFHSLTSKDAMVFSHGAIKALAANLMKIANDIRWLAGGPRCGLGEISIPANEPGSSIMPGKVNPTQAEAVTMVAVQVMANDTAIGICASQGNFELNVYMPICINSFLQSVRLLADAVVSFNNHCVSGILPNVQRMTEYLDNSLMLVTALNPHIGYENSAKVANKAFDENISLKEAASSLGLVLAEDFDRIVRPENMI